jgi:hypothetical protein
MGIAMLAPIVVAYTPSSSLALAPLQRAPSQDHVEAGGIRWHAQVQVHVQAGVPELMVIANIIVLLFRPEQLPEVDRNIRDLSNSRQELLA